MSTISEILNDEFSGVKRKVNRRNRFTMERAKWRSLMEKKAREAGTDTGTVGLSLVKKHRPKIADYVIRQGETPKEKDVDLAVQAALLRAKEINTLAKTLDIPGEQAEIFLEDRESEAFDGGSEQADYFLGGIFEAIFPAAKKALNNASVKRAKKGKKTGGLLGFLNKAIGGERYKDIKSATDAGQDLTIKDKPGEENKPVLKVFASDVEDKVTALKRKQEINKMLPYIVLGVAALVLITVLIVRRK